VRDHPERCARQIQLTLSSERELASELERARQLRYGEILPADGAGALSGPDILELERLEHENRASIARLVQELDATNRAFVDRKREGDLTGRVALAISTVAIVAIVAVVVAAGISLRSGGVLPGINPGPGPEVVADSSRPAPEVELGGNGALSPTPTPVDHRPPDSGTREQGNGGSASEGSVKDPATPPPAHVSVPASDEASPSPAAQVAAVDPSPDLPEEEPRVSAREAHHVVGSVATVCGLVHSVTMPQVGGYPTYLNFEEAHPNQPFAVVIWASDRRVFPLPIREMYTRQQICVRGEIRDHEGTPQMTLRSPDAVQKVGGATPSGRR
jgi:hypothetical protein